MCSVLQQRRHFPHKEGRERADEHLGCVHVDIAGPVPVKSAGGKSYVYVVVDNYTRTVYTRQAIAEQVRSSGCVRIFKAAAESESQRTIRKVMTDKPTNHACKISVQRMGFSCTHWFDTVWNRTG